MNQEHTCADALQLVEEGIDLGQHGCTTCLVGNDGIYHLVVAVDDGVILLTPLLVALLADVGHSDEFVSDAVEGAYHNYDRALFGFCLNDVFQAQDAWNGTYGRSAEFQYFHSLSDSLLHFQPAKLKKIIVFPSFSQENITFP